MYVGLSLISHTVGLSYYKIIKGYMLKIAVRLPGDEVIINGVNHP